MVTLRADGGQIATLVAKLGCVVRWADLLTEEHRQQQIAPTEWTDRVGGDLPVAAEFVHELRDRACEVEVVDTCGANSIGDRTVWQAESNEFEVIEHAVDGTEEGL